MDKIIIKTNNDVQEYEYINKKRSNNQNNTYYIDNIDLDIDQIEDNQNIEKSKDKQFYYIEPNKYFLIRKVYRMASNILKNKDKFSDFSSLFELIQEAKDEDDLKAIITEFILLYKDNNKKPESTTKYESLLEKESNLTIAITIRGIIKEYISYMLETKNKYSEEIITELEKLKISGTSYNDLMSLTNIKIKKEIPILSIKELIEETFSNTLDTIYYNNQIHLCFDCQNGHADKCEKIADYQKQSLEHYQFITKGYQLVNNNQIKKFIVSECENFIIETDTTLPMIKKRRRS